MNEIDAIVTRIRAEFREMPGLRLTPAQASKLWGLETDTCRRVIDELVATAFLRWTGAGLVARTEG